MSDPDRHLHSVPVDDTRVMDADELKVVVDGLHDRLRAAVARAHVPSVKPDASAEDER